MAIYNVSGHFCFPSNTFTAMTYPRQLSLLKEQLTHLQKNRHFIYQLICQLEKNVNSPTSCHSEEEPSCPPSHTTIWGEKETIVGNLVKLTGLMAKIIPLEQDLLEKYTKLTPSKKKSSAKTLNQSDKEIIQRFLEKRSKMK